MILVGECVGMVVLGYDCRIGVRVDDMIDDRKGVKRGGSDRFIVTEMRFMSYDVWKEERMKNAGGIMEERGGDGLKVEGGKDVVYRI